MCVFMPPSLCFPLAFLGGPSLSCREARGHRQEEHLLWVGLALVCFYPPSSCWQAVEPQASRAQTQKEMGLISGLLYLSLADFGSTYSVWRHCLLILTLLGWQLCLLSSDPENSWNSPCLWSQGVCGRAEGRKEFLFIKF